MRMTDLYREEAGINESLFYRIAAVTRPTKEWPNRVHVLFERPSDGDRVGYYMDQATYRKHEIGDLTHVADYTMYGGCILAPSEFEWAQVTI